MVLAIDAPLATAQDATPTGASPPIPSTPAGNQLQWVLDQVNGGAPIGTDVTDRFAPAFLASFPAPMVRELLQQTAAEQAPITLVGFAYPPTATGAIALVTNGTGESAALTLVVESESPHRITRLELGETPGPAVPTGGRVDIGGRSLFLNCTGAGSPTVVLEGGIVSDWAAVQPAVGGITRVCSYDRPDSPGSHSDPTPFRTAQEVVDDLHTLLAAAGESGPYVLVGHSLGGLYVQLYAYQHPDEVAGLVLVDPTHEDFADQLDTLAMDAQDMPPSPATTPDPAALPSAEEVSFAQMREMRSSGALRPMALIVLSHGRIPTADERPPGWPIAEEEQLFREQHAEIARLAPNGRHVIAEDSGHNVHQDQPDLVIEAVREVVSAARDPSTWATRTP